MDLPIRQVGEGTLRAADPGVIGHGILPALQRGEPRPCKRRPLSIRRNTFGVDHSRPKYRAHFAPVKA
jgi:hypothetical protein